jgi:CheY-like chemotaxis protein
MGTSAAEMTALLVTPDTEMLAVFTQLFREMRISAQPCTDAAGAAESVLRAKFEAVVVDFDRVADEMQVIEGLRKNRANRNAVVFAVASDSSSKERARIEGARFVLERPFARLHIARVLRAAYGFMLQDRRQYFRLPITLDVSLRPRGGAELRCKTINFSKNGMAVNTPLPLTVGEVLDVVIAIPTPGPAVIAEAAVIWDDRHGKAGLRLGFATSEVQRRVSEWLDSEFYTQFDIATTN